MEKSIAWVGSMRFGDPGRCFTLYSTFPSAHEPETAGCRAFKELNAETPSNLKSKDEPKQP